MKVICLNCGAEFNKFPNQIKSSPRHFCSRSCAVSMNNRLVPKRKAVKRFCKHCSIEISRLKTVCSDCNKNNIDWSVVRLADMHNLRNYQKSSRIRQLARAIYKKSTKPKHCIVCSYDKAYDICHIKAIKDYPAASFISEVNDLTNLIALCKNHHWELDHGMLTLSS